MKERDKLRIVDPGWGHQMGNLLVGDCNLVVNWVNGRWKINHQIFKAEVQTTQNLLDKTDIRPTADLLDICSKVGTLLEKTLVSTRKKPFRVRHTKNFVRPLEKTFLYNPQNPQKMCWLCVCCVFIVCLLCVLLRVLCVLLMC